MSTYTGRIYWTVGYAPFTTMKAGVYTTKAEAEREAKRLNTIPEYKGRGLKAYRCDVNGRLVR